MTARLPFQITICTLLFVAIPAWAALPPPCVVSGTIELTPTNNTFYCDGDFVFEPGTKIITHDQDLDIRNSTQITFGKGDKGVEIVCATENEIADLDASCGKVEISTATLDGNLEVTTRAPGAKTGKIIVRYLSHTGDYRQRLRSKKGLVDAKRGTQITSDADVAIR